MSSHSGTIGRKRDYYFGGDQIRRQRSAEWHSRHGYSSSEEDYQNNPQNSIGTFDTQLLASLLIQSQQLANIDRSYRSDCDNEEVTESLLTEYPQSYQNAAIASPHTTMKSSRNPFSLKYEIHPPTEPDRVSFTGSVATGFDRLQAAAEISGSNSTYLQANSLSHNPNNTVRASRSKNARLNRVSGMTSSSSATSSNSNPVSRSERERQKMHQQQQQQQHQQLQQELKELSNVDSYSDADKTIFEPPPDPAPPEIPPRTQSLLLSMRKRSDYQLKFEENGDQKHEEFIPQSQQKDYLMAENSRSSEFPSKSITSSDSPSQQGRKLSRVRQQAHVYTTEYTYRGVQSEGVPNTTSAIKLKKNTKTAST